MRDWSVMAADEYAALLERAALAYRPSGRYAYHFARGKLRHDPLFRYLASALAAPAGDRILDLGCGQGLLFALLVAARGGGAELIGIDLDASRIDVARRALGMHASFVCADVREAPLPRASTMVIADVLLYLSEAQQTRLLEACASALAPGGTLLLREADASAGVRFAVTRWSERFACALRGSPRQQLHYRRADEWRLALETLGLTVTARPMSEGVPFANVLFEGRKPDA